MSFEIVELLGGEVVRTIPSRTRGRQRERVLAGLLRNLDHEHYFIRDLVEEAEEQEASIELARVLAAAPRPRGRVSGLA